MIGRKCLWKWIIWSCLLILGNATCFSQSKEDKELLNSYKAYTSLSREVIYLHLNKTDCFQGEQVGFKAYVTDKHSKKPALKTSNLYVQIVDGNNEVIKEQLLQIKNGITHGTFKIDTLFGFKNYVIKAFTNWSRNFEEPNSFEQVIRVLDINTTKVLDGKSIASDLELSFMPEGGHFIANTLNSLGIRARNNNGFAVPNLKLKLLNEQNELIKSFKLNDKGLAKVLVNPKMNIRFRLLAEHSGKEHVFNLPEAEERGFGLILTNRKNSLLFNLNTNAISLPLIKEKDYKLAIHNGSELKIVRLPKFDKTAIAYNIPKNTLFQGINILTVLDATNLPLLERIYFHQTKSKVHSAENYRVATGQDSITLSLNYNTAIPNGNLSISVLPPLAIANNQQESIASFGFLRPHLNSVSEITAGYFKSESHKAKELDLMLLVHGWSAYDWSNILHFRPKPEFDFEKGIKVTIANKKKKTKNWIAFPHQGAVLRKFNPLDEGIGYALDSLFPYQNDKLRISEIDIKGDFREPFFNNKFDFLPANIPEVDLRLKLLPDTNEMSSVASIDGENFDFTLPLDSKTIALDEVVVSENRTEDLRLKNLQDFSFGEVTVFDDKQRKKWPNVISFLRMQQTFGVYDNGDSLTIFNRRVGGKPLVYLDGAVLQSPMLNGNDNLSLLIGLRSEDIGYIEVNKSGIGEGVNGFGGVIRIFTRSDYSDDFKKPYEYLDFEYPMTFSRPEEYAVPLYSSYINKTYLEYGVVGWIPNLILNDGKQVEFTIPKTGLDDIKLSIQGLLDNGEFISEERVIQLN